MILALLLGCGRLAEEAQRHGVSLPGSTVGAPASAPTVVPDCSSATVASPARSCLSGTLTCDGTVSGTTLGGDSAFDDAFYAGAFCFPSGDHHAGSERVYLLDAPADTDVVVTLASSCVDLDLAAIAWDYEGSCPTEKHLISECEGDSRRGGNGTVRMQTFAPRHYLIAVDGKEGAVGPFSLSVKCTPLRPREERDAPIPKR